MSSATLGAKPGGSADASQASSGPKKAGLILATLIIVAAVANLPLAMANVALPSIGAYFDASQTQLNLVAVAYSLGLACSVLWLGALGDRYGRKMMAVLGVALAIPAIGRRECRDMIATPSTAPLGWRRRSAGRWWRTGRRSRAARRLRHSPCRPGRGWPSAPAPRSDPWPARVADTSAALGSPGSNG